MRRLKMAVLQCSNSRPPTEALGEVQRQAECLLHPSTFFK